MTKPNLTVISGGSPWLVEFLDGLIAKVKAGEINAIAIAWGEEDCVHTDWIMSPDARQLELLGGIDVLRDRLMDHIRGK